MKLRLKSRWFQLFCFTCIFVIPAVVNSTKETDTKLHRAVRIIGGQQAADGQWPWLVNLKGKIVTRRLFGVIPVAHKNLICGGAVINDNWILTAAHCFDDTYYRTASRDPSNWEARLAKVNLRVDVIDRVRDVLGRIFNRREWRQWNIDVKRIVMHPQYNRANFWENDIALVELEESVPSGPGFSRIRRISLPLANDTSFPPDGLHCTMKGWGCTTGGRTASRTANSVQLPMYDKRYCARTFGFRDLGNRICAGYTYNNRGICAGDSGGPLSCRRNNGEWVNVGVATFTSRDQPGNFPAVFTQVSAYVDWINSVI